MYRARKRCKHRRGRGFAMLSTVIVALLVLSACGGSDKGQSVQEDRQFANNAPTAREHQPTETPAPVATSGPTITPIPAASPETLLRAKGAPEWIAAELKGTVFVIDPSSSAPTPIILHLPANQHLLNYGASPDGARVAVLATAMPGDDSGISPVSLLMFDHDGKQSGESLVLFDDGANATPMEATPATDAPEPPLPTVSWSAQSDRVLVSSGDGRFVIVSVTGERQPLTIDGLQGQVKDATWSPDGDRILLLIDRGSGLGSIALATPVDGKATAETIWPRSDEAHRKSVDAAVWMPNENGVMFTQSTVRAGEPVDAQLFTLALDGTAPQLVATAGRGGPSAQISDFALAPDGSSVAYTIVRPQGNGWVFHSLWIRSLDGATVVAVPVGAVETVSGLEWSAAGLLWRQVLRDSTGVTREELALVGHDISVHVLARTRPAATPVPGSATPETSPASSPSSPPA